MEIKNAMDRIGDFRRQVYAMKFTDPELVSFTDGFVTFLEDFERVVASLEERMILAQQHQHVENMRF